MERQHPIVEHPSGGRETVDWRTPRAVGDLIAKAAQSVALPTM